MIQAQLLYLDNADPGKDISIYINSPGGSVYALSLIHIYPKLLCDYASEDAYVTLRLYHALHKQLSPTEQRLLTEVEIPLLSLIHI